MNYQIICSDALSELRKMEAESVHMVCTSPPYWGLRDYKLPLLVWGGREDCEHEWLESSRYWDNRSGSLLASEGNADFGGKKDARGYIKDNFCSLCNAWKGSLGLEPTIELWAEHLTWIFRELRRVLRPDGTLWLEIGYSWDGRGNVVNQPSILRDALVKDGWYCKAPIVWHHTNAMPESVTKRPTKAHSIVWLLAKDKGTKYFYDAEAIKEQGPEWAGQSGSFNRNSGKATLLSIPGQDHASHRQRDDRVPSGHNKRTVWPIPTQPLSLPHFASFPEALVEPCIKAGTSLMGCCPECGAPWERVVDIQRSNESGWGKQGLSPADVAERGKWAGDVKQDYKRAEHDIRLGPTVHITTLSRQPTCSHPHTEADTVPCVVLDPFVGSGTVGVVALKLGRRFIGIELSEEYVEMSKERIGKVAPLFTGAS